MPDDHSSPAAPMETSSWPLEVAQSAIWFHRTQRRRHMRRLPHRFRPARPQCCRLQLAKMTCRDCCWHWGTHYQGLETTEVCPACPDRSGHCWRRTRKLVPHRWPLSAWHCTSCRESSCGRLRQTDAARAARRNPRSRRQHAADPVRSRSWTTQTLCRRQ